jgi:hypothetical protein
MSNNGYVQRSELLQLFASKAEVEMIAAQVDEIKRRIDATTFATKEEVASVAVTLAKMSERLDIAEVALRESNDWKDKFSNADPLHPGAFEVAHASNIARYEALANDFQHLRETITAASKGIKELQASRAEEKQAKTIQAAVDAGVQAQRDKWTKSSYALLRFLTTGAGLYLLKFVWEFIQAHGKK